MIFTSSPQYGKWLSKKAWCELSTMKPTTELLSSSPRRSTRARTRHESIKYNWIIETPTLRHIRIGIEFYIKDDVSASLASGENVKGTPSKPYLIAMEA